MDNYYVIILSIGTFFVQLQFLFLLRYNHTIALMFAVLRHSVIQLTSVVLSWIIMFIAFAIPLYMLIGRMFVNYSTPYRISNTLLASSLGKFNFGDFIDEDHPFARVFLLIYLMVMMFIVINFFVTVLNEFISYLKENPSIVPPDHEVIDYFLDQLKGLIYPASEKPATGIYHIDIFI